MGVVVPDLTSVKVEDFTVVESIASENVAVTSVSRPTPVVPSEGLTLLILGGVASTVQLRLAGVVSGLPAGSIALT